MHERARTASHAPTPARTSRAAGRRTQTSVGTTVLRSSYPLARELSAAQPLSSGRRYVGTTRRIRLAPAGASGRVSVRAISHRPFWRILRTKRFRDRSLACARAGYPTKRSARSAWGDRPRRQRLQSFKIRGRVRSTQLANPRTIPACPTIVADKWLDSLSIGMRFDR